MVTLGELYVSIEKRLEELFPEDRLSARLEAELIVEYSTGYRRTDRVTDPQAPVSEEKLQAAQDMLSRRLDGEPVQYIIGETGFYDMMFFVGEGVLIPRQDTEVLVETAEAHINSGMLCADLCAGSGCIGLTLCERTGCDVRA